MKQNKHIIIAGGKTGGHLFPGIAVAQAVKSLAPGTQVLFVGTRAPFEINTLARYGFDHKTIISRPIKGGNLLNKAWSSALVLISIIQALYIIIRFRADFILGVGGFSSFALVVAGRLLFRQTAIQEQNAIPGMTNRLLSKVAHTLFISFEQTKGMPVNHKTILAGNPMRQGLTSENIKEAQVLELSGPKDFIILITGGSQGSASINKAFTEAVSLMEDTDTLFIVHQTGESSVAEITDFYKTKNLKAEARAFFHDMPAIQTRADLIISRAGASTLSELAIKAKPAILIPFPYAADDHQTANAQNLADQGAALMIADKNLSGETLYTMIRDLRENPRKREEMRKAMAALARPKGADIIARHILKRNSRAEKGDN